MNRAALLVVLIAALAATGCGLGEGGAQPGGSSILVTRDFGSEQLGSEQATDVPEGETVMRLLQRRFDVETRYGGAFVDAIDGLKGGTADGRRTDWFFYVNGIESEVGAAAFKLSPGDRIWWDHRNWSATQRIPAVVGSFPEPFKSGYRGKRRPVRLDCGRDVERACDEVTKRLVAAEVQVSRAALPTPAGPETLRVLVGRWADVRRDRSAESIERGPEASGVFARFTGSGASMELLDEAGEVERAVGAGGGLIAATRYEDQQPTWVVTGVDVAGVISAASAFDEQVLGRRFAVAVEDGRSVPLPVRPPPEELER